MVVIGRVNFKTAAYVARYVMKKKNGKLADDDYLAAGHKKEFIRTSRMPGIGREYYDRNKKIIYKTDEVFVPSDNSSIRLKPPTYYDRLMAEDDPMLMVAVKNMRKKFGEIANENALSEADLNEFEFAEVRLQNKNDRIRKLIRDKI